MWPKTIPGVLCCGNLVRDILVAPVDEPRWGRTVWVDSIEEGFGGNGANTSYTLARLATPVRLIGTLGADEAGDRIAATLQAAGVDMTFVNRSSKPTPGTVVLVNHKGARALLHRPGASHDAFADAVELTPELTAGCTRFHLANVFALPALRPRAADLVARARQAGMSVSIDTGWDARGEWLDVLGPCLPHADLLFVNEDEARELTGLGDPVEAARTLEAHGVGTVVVKLGAAGCVVVRAKEIIASPGFAIPVVDTTGAGDCFAGGFLAALQRGLSYAHAARFANAVGALSVQKLGGTTGLLGYEDTMEWARHRQTALHGNN
jgi:sugar/nucleoside kinase (ribokinase family)